MSSLAALEPPAEPGIAADLVAVATGRGSWLSWLVPDLVQRFLGIDLEKPTRDRFAGDWAGLARAGEAFSSLGAFHTTLADEVAQDTSDVGSDWSGNAAEAARAYLRGLVDAVEGRRQVLTEVGRRLVDVAWFVSDRAELVGARRGDLDEIDAEAARVENDLHEAERDADGLDAGRVEDLRHQLAELETRGAAVADEIARLFREVDDAVTAARDAVAGVTDALGSGPGGYDHPFAEADHGQGGVPGDAQGGVPGQSEGGGPGESEAGVSSD
ncbi:hypothetical protein Bcav_2541 [Beutenbergia cavernae DSM 12333]|uniref:Uncharacterized protein n=1 Tax=Beutenbergia cavernae (strain ATCC BAA-8 / DSM 12333 / CCUG 43141 / JCM 11478 / NBRC 16432 / NCIMB 13614 / HKI 0122) TaxID=471853 RepID=C5BWX2_BEUC1|nr:hypothetical protein [Beutenbergia cavernae]ACQ80788.1 hypothetical protein Bcav_2541 [Beutenbergia cavernae DSM 12333]